MAHLQKSTVIVCNKYPNNLKMRVSVGIKSDLGKALIASNSGSIVKINISIKFPAKRHCHKYGRVVISLRIAINRKEL